MQQERSSHDDEEDIDDEPKFVIPASYHLPPLPASLYQYNDIQTDTEVANAQDEPIIEEPIIDEPTFIIPRHKPIIAAFEEQIINTGPMEDDDSFHVVDYNPEGTFTYEREKSDTTYTTIPSSPTTEYSSTLYPSAPSESLTIRNTTVNNDEEFVGDFAYKSDTLPNIYDNLLFAPFLQMKATLDRGYLTGHLLNEEQVLNRFNQHVIDFEDEFYKLVQKLYDTTLQLFQVRQKLKELKTESVSLAEQTFLSKSVTHKSPSVRCGDMQMVSGTVVSKEHELNQQNYQQLGKVLETYRSTFYHDITVCEFELRLVKRKIDSYLDTLYSKSPFSEVSTGTTISVSERPLDVDQQELCAKLENCIRILFDFEKKTRENENEDINKLKDTLRAWIRQTIAYKLRTADINGHRFIIHQVVRSREVGMWGPDLIQVPDIKDDQSMDFFIIALSAFLKPVINPAVEEMEYILSEEDYVCLWEQFPLFDAVHYLFVESKLNQLSSFHQWETTFLVMETILYKLEQALHAFNVPKQRMFARQLCQTIDRYVQTSTSILKQQLLLDIHGTYNDRIFQFYNALFIKSFFSIFRAVDIKQHTHDDTESALWGFLVEMPYEEASDLTATILFWSIFSNNENSDIGATHADFKDFTSWQELVAKCPKVREGFAEMMMDMGSLSFYLVPVFTKIASSHHSSLAAIIIHELFLVAFVHPKTRETLYHDIISAIGSICTIHTQLTSMVLGLTVKYFKYMNREVGSLFKNLPLKLWVCNENDVELLSSLLNNDIKSLQFAVGKLIIQRISWNVTITAPHIQKRLCISIINALTKHKAQTWNGFLSISSYVRSNATEVDAFQNWVWRIITRAQLTDINGSPLTELESINEATMTTLVKNVKDSVDNKTEFDATSAYLLLSLTHSGYDVAEFKVAAQSSVDWFQLMLQWKKYAQLTRTLVDTTLRLLRERVDKHGYKLGTFGFQGVVQQLYTPDSFVGRMMAKTVTPRLVQLVDYVCVTLTRITIEDLAVEFALYWLDSFFNVTEFNTTWMAEPCCLYSLNRISETLIIHCSDLFMNSSQLRERLSSLLGRTYIEDEFKKYDIRNASFFTSGEYPSKYFEKGIFSAKTIEIDRQHPHLAFLYLIHKSITEQTHRRTISSLWNERNKPMDAVMKDFYQNLNTNTQPHELSIYRVLAHCLAHSRDLVGSTADQTNMLESCVILYWQLFFNLYCESIPGDNSTDQSRKVVKFFGFAFLDAVRYRSELMHDMVTTFGKLAQHYGFKIQRLESAMDQVPGASELIQIYNRLHRTYTAMSYWIKDSATNFYMFIGKIQNLPQHTESARLFSVINEICYMDHKVLWFDLVPLEPMRNMQQILLQSRNTLTEIIPITNDSTNIIIAPTIDKIVNVNSMRGRERHLMRVIPPITTNGSSLLLFNRENTTLVLKSWDSTFIRDALNFYSGCLQRHLSWDNEYLSHMTKLYRNVTKLATLELTCYKGKMFCSRPAVVQFSYPTTERSNEVDKRLQANRTTVNQFMSGDESSMLYSNISTIEACLRLEFTVDYLIRHNQHKPGVKWFFILASAYDTIVSQFSTLKKFWKKQLLKPLAEKFMINNKEESLQLLAAMIDNSGNIFKRVKLMTPYLNPNICGSELWRSLLERVHAAANTNGSEQVLPLYDRFNITNLLQTTETSYETRKSLLEHAIAVIKDYHQKFEKMKTGTIKKTPETRQAADLQVFHYYLDFFLALLSYNFPELCAEALTLVLAGATQDAVPVGVLLQRICDELSFDKMVQDGDFEHLEQNVNVICQYIWEWRRAKNTTVYDCAGEECLRVIVSMIRKMFTSIHGKFLVGETNLSRVFELLCRLIEPFVFAISAEFFYNTAETQSAPKNTKNATVLPWNPRNYSHVTNAVHVLTCFIDVVGYILPFDQEILSHVWHMYSQVLCKQFNAPQLRQDFLNLFHYHFAKLDWAQWMRIDQTQLSQMTECAAVPAIMIKRSSLSTKDLRIEQKLDELLVVDGHAFLTQLVTQLSWHTIFGEISQTHELSRSLFCSDFIIILMELTLLQGRKIDSFIDFLEKRIVPLILSDNLRSYIRVNDCVNIFKKCTALIMQYRQSPLAKSVVTEKHFAIIFALLESVAQQDLVVEELQEKSNVPYSYEQQGFEFSVTLNPDLLAFHTSANEEQTQSIEPIQGEGRAAYHLQNYITFLFHTISTNARDTLYEYLKKSKYDLLTWILENLVIRIKNKETVEQVESDPLSMNIISQILQIFNYTLVEFEEMCSTFLRFLLKSRELSLPTLTACTRCISSLPKLSFIMECCIRSHCLNSCDILLLEARKEDLWLQIVPRVGLANGDALIRQEFLTHCISSGCALTAYAQARYRIAFIKDPITEVEKELATLIVPYLNMFSEGQLSMQEFIFTGRTQGDNLFVPHQELYMIPLWVLFLDLTASMIDYVSMGGNNTMHRSQVEGLIKFVDTLLRISGDRTTSGAASKFFEKIGGLFGGGNKMAKFKVYSDDFKLCVARPLGLYLLGRSLDWHPNPTETRVEYQKLLTAMTKHQAGMKESVDGKKKIALDVALNEYIREPSTGFGKASELLRRLVILVHDASSQQWLQKFD